MISHACDKTSTQEQEGFFRKTGSVGITSLFHCFERKLSGGISCCVKFNWSRTTRSLRLDLNISISIGEWRDFFPHRSAIGMRASSCNASSKKNFALKCVGSAIDARSPVRDVVVARAIWRCQQEGSFDPFRDSFASLFFCRCCCRC